MLQTSHCRISIKHEPIQNVSIIIVISNRLSPPQKAQRGREVYLYSFFNLGARWGGWSKPRPDRFTPGIKKLYP
jgi:hypothetical protein